MTEPETDLLGNPLSDVEKEVAKIHAALESLAGRPDLSPCVESGTRHALAATWQMMNDLAMPCRDPEDV